jgi:hypothetical protein
MAQKEYEGYNGTLILTDTSVVIKRGLKGVLLGGGSLRGDKSIPYSSIAAVQLKNGGLTAGYLQLTLIGGSEAKSGLFQATTDENTVMFYSGSNNQFEEAKQLLEKRILAARSGVAQPKSDADELEKFASLRDKGVITEEEFQQKKKQILNL